MFLFGFLIRTIPGNVHKTCGVWFQGRHLGLANGVASMGMASGFMLGSMISATLLSPWLGGWKPVLFVYGAVAMAVSIPWLVSRERSPRLESPRGQADAPSARRALSRIARLRTVWLFGFAILGIGGCVLGTLGYLPLYLREIGWPEARADGALAAFHGISMLLTLPVAWLSDRLGSRKRVIVATATMITLGVGLLAVAEGWAIWIGVLLAGMVRDGFMAVFMTAVIETPGVGPRYAGTAVGFVMVFAAVGGLLAPVLGNALAEIDPALPFALWAAMAAAGGGALCLVAEPGGE
jgi:CP family cyanate transporter-like MFS transporter